MLERQSTVSYDDNGHPLSLYPNATSASASASYQSFKAEDGFSYVLKLLDNEDYQTRTNLVAEYEVISKGRPPIGLQLRKSPSLLELFENKLYPPLKPMPQKVKAVHFPISVLQIGNFTKVATHQADLVAKCYYAKRKLVWETLDNGLKNKMEIQWQDILSLRAVIEYNKPGILQIELNQPPTFCHEADPKPRKHTIWKSSDDFTGNQASIYRMHHLEFAPGVLDKHYEKLIQCDSRLVELSKGPCPRLSNPYFTSAVPVHSNEYTDFSNYGYDVFANRPSTSNHSPVLTIHQFGKGIQSPTSASSGMGSLSIANTVELELQRTGFENLSNMANMILTDSDPETLCQERHMAKVKSSYSFAGLSMVGPTHNINTFIQSDSWDELNNSNRSVQEHYASSNANANLHVYGQFSDEARLNHTQPLQYVPSLEVSDGNTDAPVPDTLNPLIILKWSGQHDYYGRN